MQLHSLSRCLLFSLCMYGLPALADLPKKDKKMAEKTAIPAKIAIIDMRRILTEDPKELENGSNEWRELYTKLQDKIKPANKEITDLEAQLKKEVEDLEKLQKSGVSSREKLQETIMTKIEPLDRKRQKLYQEYQRFVAEEGRKIQNVIEPKIQKALDEVCDAQGWDFPLLRDAVPGKRINPRFDITEDVIRTLNEHFTEEKARKSGPARAV